MHVNQVRKIMMDTRGSAGWNTGGKGRQTRTHTDQQTCVHTGKQEGHTVRKRCKTALTARGSRRSSSGASNLPPIWPCQLRSRSQSSYSSLLLKSWSERPPRPPRPTRRSSSRRRSPDLERDLAYVLVRLLSLSRDLSRDRDRFLSSRFGGDLLRRSSRRLAGGGGRGGGNDSLPRSSVFSSTDLSRSHNHDTNSSASCGPRNACSKCTYQWAGMHVFTNNDAGALCQN